MELNLLIMLIPKRVYQYSIYLYKRCANSIKNDVSINIEGGGDIESHNNSVLVYVI
jgi:hypothetical protein